MMEPSYQDAKDLQPVIQRWRRELHQIPEIGLKLPKTEAYVKEQLCKMGLTYREFPTHSGLVVDIGRPGQLTVAVRADMDALPIQEETGLDFASTNENMHACGHDAHTAMLLGLAQLLKKRESTLPGRVRLLFQPGEEFPGGAEPMVRDGVMDGVDYILALHVSDKGPFDCGDVAVNYRHCSAADDQLYLTIRGRGGHGAAPQKCVDPVTIAALVVNNLQYIISREMDPFQPSVLTIATLRAGKGATNIIPDSAEVIGTIRNVDLESRNYVLRRIREIVDHTVAMMRGEYDLEFRDPYPPVINDPKVVQHFLNAADRVMGPGHSHILERPEMGGEDAAFFFQKAPGCYFYLQCPAPCPCDGKIYPAHNAKFCIDDSKLYLGSALFLETALEILTQGR